PRFPYTTLFRSYLRAEDPGGVWTVVAPREHEHEYEVDHGGDVFYVRTNGGGRRNFRLVTAPVADPRPERWTELVPHRETVMLEGVDVFTDHYVLQEREDGLVRLRVTALPSHVSHHVAFPEPAYEVEPEGAHGLRRVRDAVSRDLLVEPFEPSRARRGRRGRPCARGRGAREALARRRAAPQEAQHVHRFHRVRRAPGPPGLDRARSARDRGRERGRPPARRRAEHAARPLHGRRPPRAVRGRAQHDARSVAPADGGRVRGVGQPEAPRALRVYEDLLPVHEPRRPALPGDPRAHRAERQPSDVLGARQVGREAPDAQARRSPAAPQ